MSMHNEHGHNEHGHGPEKVDASAGFERTDANVTGIVVFITALGIFVAVTGLLCYGIGAWMNARMNREDGPNSKWTKTADVRQLGNLPSSPELQNKVAELTKTFPTPRLQTDDGNQDVADLHARENLLLDNYTWIDQPGGKVRIPIDRAMELIAQQGLPVAAAVTMQPAMTGDSRPTITMPLTDGFAPTGYEQEEQAQEEALRKQEAAAK
ncbi:MAG: hypothetical protein WBA18_02305 [Terracidiphilus sp.]